MKLIANSFFLILIFLVQNCSMVFSSTQYSYVQLEDILQNVIPNSIIVKDNINRIVYYSEGNFYKIWNENYYPGITNFEIALERDFFSDISPLVAIIIDQNHLCRGYVTYACMKIKKDVPIPIPIVMNKINNIADCGEQTATYKYFFDKLVEKSEKSLLFFSDLNLQNIVFDNGRILIIDLESVCPIEEIDRFERQGVIMHSLPEDYVKIIKKFKKV